MTRGRRIFTDQSEIDCLVFSRTLACAGVITITLLPFCMYNLIYIITDIKPIAGLKEVFEHDRSKVVKVLLKSHMSPQSALHLSYISAIQHILPSFCFFLIFGTGGVAVRYYFRVFSRIAIATRLLFGLVIREEANAEPGLTPTGVEGQIVQVTFLSTSTVKPLLILEQRLAARSSGTDMAENDFDREI